MPEDLLPLVKADGTVIGTVRRSDAHGNPALLHPVVHCVVVNARGDILLQLRSADKDIQPGKWDTSVGGHVDAGETIEQALARELAEEIGLDASVVAPRYCYRYNMTNDIESELIHTFTCVSEGPFRRQASEVDELRFWTRSEIRQALGSGLFTPNFEEEFERFIAVESSAEGD